MFTGACPGPPPPLEIEKQKKMSSEQILSYHTYICYFFSRRYHFLCYFLSWAPIKKLKSKKKPFRCSPPPPPPPPYEFLDTPLV